MDKREYLIFLVFFLMLLSFLYGAVSTSMKLFPYTHTKPYLSIVASVADALSIDQYNMEIRWKEKSSPETGVVVFDREAVTAEGGILYVTTHDTAARLIDRDGQSLYRWDVPFSAAWDNQDQLISLFPLDDSFFYLRDAHVYDNGDLLVLVSAGGITPWGVGLVKVDKDSNVLWTFTDYNNNDVSVQPDGTIYAVVHAVHNDALPALPEVPVPFLEDNIVHLDAQGKELGRISLLEAFANSPYRGIFKQLGGEEAWDLFHSNAIAPVLEDSPSVPWLKKGYLILSIRNVNAIAVLDPESGVIVRAFGLPTRMQHDVDYLENGNFMIFDNQGDFLSPGYTRVLEFNPADGAVVWSYNGKPGQPEFESEYFGEQQRLENGHTLITDAETGRLFEVNPAGDIVWDYNLPLGKEIDGERHTAVITHAEWISPARLQFITEGK